ncbi:MAG: polymerase, sigma-24 subunit, subfamily [bacterium]|nr:polymerase, sigma-24 subunit, subfamily [bacterium]
MCTPCYREEVPTADDGATLIERARARWPTIAWTAELEARFRQRLQSPAEALHAEDLYLACACAERSAAAFDLFEREYLSQVARSVHHLGVERDFVDEVTQLVRERLFVGDHEHGPKIGDYSGKGSLAGWLRVIAVRVAIDLRRATGRMTSAIPEDLISANATSDAVYVKRRYRAVLQDAINRAIVDLSDEQRVLLRRHFVEGVTFDALAAAAGVHKVTVWRQIVAARNLIVASMRSAVGVGALVGSNEFESILRTVQSQLDFSLSIR